MNIVEIDGGFFVALPKHSVNRFFNAPPRGHRETRPRCPTDRSSAAERLVPNAAFAGAKAQGTRAYCIYVPDKNARAVGASEAETREAVATAAQVRHWRTVLNGLGYDLAPFKTEFDRVEPSK